MTTPQPNPTDDLEAVARIIDPETFDLIAHYAAIERFDKKSPAEREADVFKGYPSLQTARDAAFAKAAAILALRPAGVGEAVDWPEREKDLRWLEWQKETGHCGESTSEAIQRGRINGCIDRILKALATPAHPDAALMERVRETLVYADLTIRSFPTADQSHVEPIRALLSDLKAEAGR